MSRRRASARRIKQHYNYTVEEAADATGAHKNTVRRWVAAGKVPALTEMRPHLVLGRDLIRFLTAPKPGAVTLKPGECYCVKCKQARRPALDMADFALTNERWGNLRGLCPSCGIIMNRGAPLTRLPEISGDLQVKILEAQPRLKGRDCPSTNGDFKED